MTKDQEKAWQGAEKTSQAERKKLFEETRTELLALLKEARDDIVLVLAGAPSDYQQWRLTELQKEIDRALAELGQSSGNVLAEAAGKAWAGGVDAIDAPMRAVGIDVALPHLDTGQLMAMRTFMVDRIDDIAAAAASKIRAELGMVMIGNRSVHETIGQVTQILGETSRARATTIVRTELGRAWAVASHERAKQAEEEGVPMDKVWRRSGKIHSRLNHDLADGQRVAMHEHFTVGTIKMRFPHDPKAPAKETINCGCIALYRPRGIAATMPDKRPFTQEEINANPYKADLEKVRTMNK